MIQISISKRLRFAEGNAELCVRTSIEEHTITALYGHSGSGKTTLLKILAGLVQPDEGTIQVNDKTWLDTHKHYQLPPQQRSIGFVFQDYALFPNMTVLENLHFAAGKVKDEAFIRYLLEIVSLQSFAQAKPAQLSGGQQQRAALIRALARKPKLLLLDEPLAALDVKMRHSLHQTLQQLQQELQFTALLVSHDVGEVYTLASHVIQLQGGKISFKGTPQQLFQASGLSSKLQLPAQVLAIIPNGVIYIVELQVAANIVKITATGEEIEGVMPGDKVMIYTKAFHVGMKKII